jgi:hypothetical protein
MSVCQWGGLVNFPGAEVEEEGRFCGWPDKEPTGRMAKANVYNNKNT